MQKKMNSNVEKSKIFTKPTKHQEIHNRLLSAAFATTAVVYDIAESTQAGLSAARVEKNRNTYGDNTITHSKKVSLYKRIGEAFINPFTIILLLLALVSLFTDIILASPGEANPTAVIIIVTMVMISGILRFVQEARSGDAAEKLLNMIATTTAVQRQEEGIAEIPLEEVVVGDIVYLAAGDMIPADMRIVQAKDLFVSQSALTGESAAVEKIAIPMTNTDLGIMEMQNLAFMGANVISGSAIGIVLATGNDTVFGNMAKSIGGQPVQTSFEKGVNSVSWLLIRFMVTMVPIVLLINGFTKGDWLEAALFALSIAVGLTPEMLPMIVTTCLAKGAMGMAKEKTIIKNLNAIQNLGSMDILCTDKTGTLTQDKVALQYHLNINGEEDVRVLRYAYLNSYFQTGLKNLMDAAIIERAQTLQDSEDSLQDIATRYHKVDEIPFDFERRRMSVVVTNGKTHMITKGAVEEMLAICSHAEYEGKVQLLDDTIRTFILNKMEELNANGMRVIAIAQKTNPSPVDVFSVKDEMDMVLIGYLAFLDPPKPSTAGALKALREHGVEVKILTGDSDTVTRFICKEVGITVQRILLGTDVEAMNDAMLGEAAEEVSIFAKLSPQQKARVINALRSNGHSVGYMGDGINDAAAMKVSDVGISVDTAVDIAKESADVVLLEKDLMVLEKGIIEGRKTYANMIKYIKMTASSNFGNMFSVLAASAFLPFIPMLPIHLILLNLIYDLSCTAIPWDNVDEEFLAKPRKWDASSVGKFMLWIGPTSSIFDITTYGLLYFVICPAAVGGLYFDQLVDPTAIAYFIALFHAGWFVESMWTQTLVIHMIRTPKIPFIQSRASLRLTLLTCIGIIVVTAIPFTTFGVNIGFAALPMDFFPWLLLTIILYMMLVTLCKKFFIRRYGELL